MSDLTNEFHQHLDACKQCREHPFNLCRTGSDALEKQALPQVGFLTPVPPRPKT